ncbi:MAG: helix-turn-helix transcriptional regulator [Planktotalea sp.]|uniref:helix-turn-helix transcriptional regulator n=1 Tax=Planktotalea sp. TaxID=2029877 RepID=UPI003C71CED9
MAELHNTLKELRSEKGFTQASLAEKVGVSRKTINTIENRVFVPSTLLSMQIAQALGVTVHDIFYMKDD